MSAFKAIFLLSLLAIFLAPRETEAQATINRKWTKFCQCAQVSIETVTNLANRVVPAIYELKTCSGYVSVARQDDKWTLPWFVKSSYELIKKVANDKSNCLLELLSEAAAQIKPYANQISTLGCLDENDFLF